MYQRDYILRMIEMLGEIIAALLGLIKKGDFAKASKTLENAFYDLLKEDASFFQMIPKEKFTEKLIGEHHYTRGHLQILAELMFAEAELEYAKGLHSFSLDFYEKSLLLFQFVEKDSRTFSLNLQNRIESVQNRIAAIHAEG